MKDCTILLWYYKHLLSNAEIVSLCRLYNMFYNKYPIVIITYDEGLKDFYELRLNNELLNKYIPENYIYIIMNNNSYFKDIIGYNTLMLSPGFYNLFDTEYIFIYHLDCYIFKDELDYWLNQCNDHIECINKCDDILLYNGEGIRNRLRCIIELNNPANFLNIANHLTLAYYQATYNFSLQNKCMTEDNLFTLILDNHNVDTNHFKFGYSFELKTNYLKYGLPMMIHYFGRKTQYDFNNENYNWLKEIIGDWETYPEECINKKFD